MSDEVEGALASLAGSPEREHVLALLRRATQVRLLDEVTEAAAVTVDGACPSIERNLDKLMLPFSSTWVEYRHRARIGFLGALPEHAPETVGCLLACDPANTSHIAVFAAWRQADGSIHHSYALMHWNKARFFSLAQAAPRRDDGCAADRLMQAADASVPPGFMTEMEIWQEHLAANDPRRGDAVSQTLRDVTGEHLFLLSTLLLLGCCATCLEPDVPASLQPEHDPPAVQAAVTAPPLPDQDPGLMPDFDPDDAGPEVPGEPRFQARLLKGAARWPWQPAGFRPALVGEGLSWSPPAARVAGHDGRPAPPR